MSRSASSLRRATAVAMLGLVTPLAAMAQSSSDRSTEAPFRWKGAVAEGAWLRVHNLNGPIRVERASGAEAEVVGTKSWRNGDPGDVRFVSQRIGTGERDVIVCALWGENSSCDENGYRSRNGNGGWRRNNDVKVEFVVRVPKGVRVMVATVNGDVDVSGATAEVKANTVNGAIEATSDGGPVTASTVNGDVRVRMGRLGGTEALSYSTVNGSMTIEMPAGDLDADLEMQTVNGRLSADYPITMQGRISSRHLRGTIGKGGRSLRFQTVNGNVDIRRRGS